MYPAFLVCLWHQKAWGTFESLLHSVLCGIFLPASFVLFLFQSILCTAPHGSGTAKNRQWQPPPRLLAPRLLAHRLESFGLCVAASYSKSEKCLTVIFIGVFYYSLYLLRHQFEIIKLETFSDVSAKLGQCPWPGTFACHRPVLESQGAKLPF